MNNESTELPVAETMTATAPETVTSGTDGNNAVTTTTENSNNIKHVDGPTTSPSKNNLRGITANPSRRRRKPRRTSELIEAFDDDIDWDAPTTPTQQAQAQLDPSFEFSTVPKSQTSSFRHRRPKPIKQQSELIELGPSDDDDDDNNNFNNNNGHQRSSQHFRAQRRRSSAIVPDKHEVSYHPAMLQCYKPPKQRQRWGQKQVLPRVNWGDLFFDLFYVAAAYNTSNILVDSPTRWGVVYFLTTFFTVMHIWFQKTHYDARYVVMDDVFHRLYEIMALVVLASAVVHIRPMEVLSKPSKYIDCFALTLSFTVAQLVNNIRYAEVYFFGKGQRDTIQSGALYDAKPSIAFMLVQMSAAIIAGMDYFSNQDNSYDDSTEDAYGYGYSATNDTATNGYEDGTDHRGLAGEDDDYPTNHIPIVICFVGVLCNYAFATIQVIFLFPNDGSHKQKMVPMNVNFTIHRDGEWTMLMLGESILSLLIVDVPGEDKDYFTTFYCGLLTVIFLQYLYFRSLPHDADDHAIRRSKNRGMFWLLSWFGYSASLVGLGAGFTIFVISFSLEEGDEGYSEYFSDNGRMLAGGEVAYSRSEYERRGALLYCVSLAVIYFTLDMMSLMHVGFQHSKKRCYCKKKQKYNIKGIVLVLIRLFIIEFVATMSRWVTDPEILVLAGFAFTLLQCELRRLGEKYLPESMEHLDDTISMDTPSNEKETAAVAAAFTKTTNKSTSPLPTVEEGPLQPIQSMEENA